MVSFNKSFILTVALAASVSALVIPHSTQENVKEDPCTVLSSLGPSDIELDHVVNCYRAIPFDSKREGSFLENLAILYDNFYVYKDLALTTPGAPFSIPSVDILADFNAIAKHGYESAYDFHHDLRLAVSRLHDAHSTYIVDCFRTYSFKQPIALYAPVVDGVQSIRVFSSETEEDLRDCEVVLIDGEKPDVYLQNWADKYTAFSKDSGVRLNFALATTIFDAKTGAFQPELGLFHSRDFLPDKPSIEYQLLCAAKNNEGSPSRFNLTGAYTVAGPTDGVEFKDVASFLESCAQPPFDAQTPSEEDIIEAAIGQPHLPHVDQQQKRARIARRADSPPPPEFKHADIVAHTELCGFYQMKEDPSVGIVHISSMMVGSEKYGSFIKGLDLLASKGVTNLIIDLTNNGGGIVQFASDVVAMFFNTPSAVQGSHAGDLRESAGVLRIGKADGANTTVETHYEPTAYVSEANGAPLTGDDIYGKSVQYTRGGRSSNYTPLVRMSWNNNLNDTKFPWSENAAKIKILTDGRCGSACGMLTDHFVTRHGVEVYAVGGHLGRSLSMFSFAGASVLSWKEISQFHMQLNIEAPMLVQAFAGTFNIPWFEVYSNGDSIPLDYSSDRYHATHRVNFTPDNMRNRDSLWKTVAEQAWGKVTPQ
ncbi:hypothetical protein DFQ27_005681 [Actinomortierella ambigua]|uniref:Tail specific protease domain-containing protein n=1 Tax=Actinomortierella ambigua TaxID=1343610 RepID=A0A9P6PY94_9FUNG|nr:hypothetical protein DFQ27_005681 [Actinomortierella ambigua]